MYLAAGVTRVRNPRALCGSNGAESAPVSAPGALVSPPVKKGSAVEILIGGGIILYLVLLITLGVITIRKGHWVMFIIGLFLPLFWLIGALLPDLRSDD